MILIRKVSDPFGWLGNMSAFPIVFAKETYRTSEALFQAMRFDDVDIKNLIREQKSPMAAKMVSKKHKEKMVVVPCSAEDLSNMEICLYLKLQQHNLVELLLATGEEDIIEDCTKRPAGSGLFWGAALKNGVWAGENHLGKLWMKIRHFNSIILCETKT